MTTATQPPDTISPLVAAELRAEMARQQKTLGQLAEVWGMKDRDTARARYDGSKSMTIQEVEAAAIWLDVDPKSLLRGKAVA